jgi:hypothetical protein
MRSPCTTKPPGKAKWRPPWSLPPPTSLPPSTLSSSSLHPHEFGLSLSYSASFLTPSRHQPIRPPPPRNQGYAKGLAVIDRPLLLLAWVCHRLLHHWHCLCLSLLMLPHPMYIMLWGCMHMVRNQEEAGVDWRRRCFSRALGGAEVMEIEAESRGLDRSLAVKNYLQAGYKFTDL